MPNFTLKQALSGLSLAAMALFLTPAGLSYADSTDNDPHMMANPHTAQGRITPEDMKEESESTEWDSNPSPDGMMAEMAAESQAQSAKAAQ